MKSFLFLRWWFVMACETAAMSSDGRAPDEAAAEPIADREDWVNDPRENAVLQLVADAEATLMASDGSELAVGLRCGLVAWPSVRPWFAVRYLLAARREGVLKRVVEEAPTSEGRIWAAYGLVEARQFDDQDLSDIADEAEAPVWTCDGCLSWRGTPAEAIEHL